MIGLIKMIAQACRLVSGKWDAAAAARDRYSVFEEPAGGPDSPRVIVMHDYQSGMEAVVAPSQGGELTSLRVRFRLLGVELIYRARDYGPTPGFRGKAPVLWPAVGPQYPVGTVPTTDRTYIMHCHGFAQALPWTEVGHSAGPKGARVTLELRDSEQTRVSYPFGFVVRAAHQLADGRLTIAYTVSAAIGNPDPMPFSIGNQMGFRLPFLEGTEPDAMWFQTPCSKQAPTPEDDRSFATPIQLGDFDRVAALPLGGYLGTPFARLTDAQGISLRISHHAFTTLPEPGVQFHVYGGPRQGFLCLEPGFGINVPVMLSPGGDWHWTVELSPEIFGEPAAMP